MKVELGWFGFWIFLAVLVYCDSQQFMAGYNVLFYEHYTDEEKRLREAVIRKAEREAGIGSCGEKP